ncbi:LMBR1 domain-containing protein 2 [Rhizopus stolonifer]|uniref:LMBR1 domain-containing protein 2 n=1 Tax=Rhizopus stolonifer TaxID=4846 RepID=A0A367KXH6_RHIST|nr:LMBR1 domain-containing protein 2 [Rhizopus stolonifer]
MAENTTLPIEPIPSVYHSDWLPLIIATVLLLIVVVFTLSRYGNIKSQAWYVSMVCTIGWFFPFWIVFLLPLDLASTVYDDRKGRVPFAYVSESFLFVAWRVLYWTSFCLTWFTIPMLQAYVNTGEFTIAKRIKSAIHVNLRFYSIYLVVGLVGLIYLVFGSGLTTREGIQSYVMAAANSWGLFLVIVLMGYGLVSVPRSLWYTGHYTARLHHLYANAARVKEECMDSELEFNELAKTMNAIARKAMTQPSDIKKCITTMNRRFPFILHEAFAERTPSIQLPTVLTEEYLVKLCRHMILAIRMKDRKTALWKNLLHEAFYLQDIVRNKDKSSRQFTSTLRSKTDVSLWRKLSSSAEWWWTIRIAPLLGKIGAIVFAIMSVCIIWSELVFNVRKPAIISIAYYILNACGTNYAALQIIAFFTLMYMCICVYSSLFKIRFFNLYLLIPNHHTDENSLLWFTGYMCKMMAPLCYNFINLAVDAPGVSEAVFTTFMGKAEYIKFLGAFADWFPVIILIPSLTLLFNIQGRCLGLCGIKSPYQANDEVDLMEDDPESNQRGMMDSDYEEGAQLIKEERRTREREINPNARVSTQSTRNSEYVNRKYKRTPAPDSLRSERDRRVDEILSARSSMDRYRDSPSSSASSTFSGNNDAVKLSSHFTSLGENLKQKLGGFFSPSMKTNPESMPSSPRAATPNDSTTHHHGTGGRVFGRPVTNENHSPFGDNRHENSNPSSRPTSPNLFFIPPSGINQNASPFARFEDASRSNNIFDDI